eukprot:3641115-Rhodomonas_salina.3
MRNGCGCNTSCSATLPAHTFTDKTGECPWCKNGTRETLTHFQTECEQFTTLELPPRGCEFCSGLMAASAMSSSQDLLALAAVMLSSWSMHLVSLSKIIFSSFWLHAMPSGRRLSCSCCSGSDAQMYWNRRSAKLRGLPVTVTAPLIFWVRGSVLPGHASTVLCSVEVKEEHVNAFLRRGVQAAIKGLTVMTGARNTTLQNLQNLPSDSVQELRG